MASGSELSGTFDKVSSAYDKMRPGYPYELYQMIFSYVHISENSRVVEVGSGTGQATGPILAKGCKLTAVEYGENLSALLREKYKGYSNLNVVTGKFEDIAFEENAYDLVFSATAFHWIPEEKGYSKVFSMLRSGGAFARFANRPFPCRGDEGLAREIDDIYSEYYYKYYDKKHDAPSVFSEEQASDIAAVAGRYGFTDIRYHLFSRERIFSAEEYIGLLGTYSDHIAIEKSIREKFFSKIKAAIERHGGSITIYDTLDLELARKP